MFVCLTPNENTTIRKSQSQSLTQSIVQDPVQRQDIEREVAMCTTLRNPFIVTFFGQATIPGKFFIVMEFVQHGSLGSLVKKGPLEIPFKIRVLLDTARGMDFLHHNSFVFFQFNSIQFTKQQQQQKSFIEI